MIVNTKPYNFKGYLIRENDYGKALILSDIDVDKSAIFIEQENIKGIEINYSLGYSNKNLQILSLFPSVKHIRIVNHTMDLSGLFFLKRLETLELGVENSQPIDFSLFPKLKECFFSWRKGSESIFKSTNLLKLGISKFPYENLNKISELSNLISLRISSNKLKSLHTTKELVNLKELKLSFVSNLINLNGIESFKGLDDLELYNIKKLDDLSKMKFLMNLKFLNIENCKKIFDIKELKFLSHLEVLYLNNCGDIKSLTPLKNLVKLKKLHFIENTKIIDGDLNLLKNKSFDSLFFQDRRHYSHKKDELN